MNTVSRTEHTHRIYVALSVWCLAAVLVAFAILYIFLVNRAVIHAAVRQDLVQQTKQLEVSVAEYEAEYAQLTRALTITVAFENGLVTHPTDRFIERLDAPIVTLNTVR
jgi:archaellum component FlaF (FlaF/FlaG flagellin family)